MPCKIDKCTMPEQMCTELCVNNIEETKLSDVLELFAIGKDICDDDCERCKLHEGFGGCLLLEFSDAIYSGDVKETLIIFNKIRGLLK